MSGGAITGDPRATLAEILVALLEDPSEDRLDRLATTHPDASQAALAYLRARHVRGVMPEAAWESTEALTRVLCVLLAQGGTSAADGLLAIALETPDDRQLRWLGELVTATVPPDDLARALIAALGQPATTRAHRNARELMYFTFDAADEDYAADDALAAELAAALRAPRVAPAAQA
jgi:hypothetical protein